jgi:hypothetical protein
MNCATPTHCLCHLLTIGLLSISDTGLGAICNFASSCHIALDLTMAREGLLDSWFSLLNAAKAEMQAAALQAIARVVGSPYNEVEIEEGGSRPSSSSSSSSAQDAKKGYVRMYVQCTVRTYVSCVCTILYLLSFLLSLGTFACATVFTVCICIFIPPIFSHN